MKLFFLFLGGVVFVFSQEISFESPRSPAALIELFTSEGCSSCPPADRQLRELKNHPGLFKVLFPVAYHVNYWDYIGWNDPLASEINVVLQQRLADASHVGLYTPAFFRNGLALRGESAPSQSLISDVQIRVHLMPDGTWRADCDLGTKSQGVELQSMWLRMDLKSDVNRGENSGRTLAHDFVADQILFQSLDPKNSKGSIRGRLAHKTPDAKAVLFILRKVDGGEPLQVAGGWIKNPE